MVPRLSVLAMCLSARGHDRNGAECRPDTLEASCRLYLTERPLNAADPTSPRGPVDRRSGRRAVGAFSAYVALALLTVFLVNLAPAFMPPTWSVLAFFLVAFDLPLAPLAVGGAIAASAGRLALALASRRWGSALLPSGRRRSLRELGVWLETRARWAPALAMLVYSFGPIPSNQLFVAAGLTGMRLPPIVAAFLVGRLISYTFWVNTARVASRRLEDVFEGYWRDGVFVALEVGLIVLLVAFTLVDWPRLLRARVS